MYIAENIKRLRRERGLTQEQLAAIIGVTSQAVSKWECDGGLPDITFIPSIAAAFGVTIDELFGTDKRKAEELLNEIFTKTKNLPRNNFGLLEEEAENSIVSELRDAIKQFPREWRFRTMLASYLNKSGEYGLEGYEEKSKAKTTEAITIYEYIVEHCNDNEIKNTSILTLSSIYAHIEQREKALEYANKLLPFALTKEYALAEIYDGEERTVFLQSEINRCIRRVYTLTRYLSGTLVHVVTQMGKETGYTLEEKREIVEFGVSAIELLGNTKSSVEIIAASYYVLAIIYGQAGDKDNAIKYLEKTTDSLANMGSDLPLVLQKTPDAAFEGIHGVSLTSQELFKRLTEHIDMLPFRDYIDDERFKAVLVRVKDMVNIG